MPAHHTMIMVPLFLSKPVGELQTCLASLFGPCKQFNVLFLGGWGTEGALTPDSKTNRASIQSLGLRNHPICVTTCLRGVVLVSYPVLMNRSRDPGSSFFWYLDPQRTLPTSDTKPSFCSKAACTEPLTTNTTIFGSSL